MTVLKRRDRVLIFRLTQDEYNGLLEACSEKGGRNLSDFARTKLLGIVGGLPSETHIEGRLNDVERQLSDMRSAVHRMTHLLESMAESRTKRKART